MTTSLLDRLLRVSATDVRVAYRTDLRVYGTSEPTLVEDFCGELIRIAARR